MTQMYSQDPTQVLDTNGSLWNWDVSTSITSAGYSAVNWKLISLGGSGAGTISQQAFTFAQTAVPGNPSYFLQWNQTGSGVTGTPEMRHYIEDVETAANEYVTVEFWYNSNVPVNLAMIQNFGSGGSPSSEVTTALQVLPSTGGAAGMTLPQRAEVRFFMPSLAGKAKGSTLNTSFIALSIQPPQVGTFLFEIAMCRIVKGGSALPNKEAKPRWLDNWLCKRLYWKATIGVPVSSQSKAWSDFPVSMRVAPTPVGAAVTFSNTTTEGTDMISTGAAADVACTFSAQF
jgi:hypothetical protein